MQAFVPPADVSESAPRFVPVTLRHAAAVPSLTLVTSAHGNRTEQNLCQSAAACYLHWLGRQCFGESGCDLHNETTVRSKGLDLDY